MTYNGIELDDDLQGLLSHMDRVAFAIAVIYKGRLYLEQHKDWEAYVADRIQGDQSLRSFIESALTNNLRVRADDSGNVVSIN